jgi:thiamine kinase-like enzyme
MRIPGEGTSQLINRADEYRVYQALSGLDITEDVVYMAPQSGLKISRYVEDARVCDPGNKDEVRRCMAFLRAFHEKKLTVEHEFDLYERIDFYEGLWQGRNSIFSDYATTKANVLALAPLLEELSGERSLTHIDAVPDNFLLENGRIRLIDWEYAAMQDPHLDLAMFAVYSMYEKEQVEFLIDSYFTEGCPPKIRWKIYCFIATAGLLWSNWCEYKRFCGVEFGEYSLRQYRFAKEYYKIATEYRPGRPKE